MTTREQHMEALALANKVRLRKAKVKSAVSLLEPCDGFVKVALIIEKVDPPSMKVNELLLSIKGVGFDRSRRLARHAGIMSMDRRLSELTDRQREALVFALRNPSVVIPTTRVKVS